MVNLLVLVVNVLKIEQSRSALHPYAMSFRCGQCVASTVRNLVYGRHVVGVRGDAKDILNRRLGSRLRGGGQRNLPVLLHLQANENQ